MISAPVTCPTLTRLKSLKVGRKTHNQTIKQISLFSKFGKKQSSLSKFLKKWQDQNSSLKFHRNQNLEKTTIRQFQICA